MSIQQLNAQVILSAPPTPAEITQFVREQRTLAEAGWTVEQQVQFALNGFLYGRAVRALEALEALQAEGAGEQATQTPALVALAAPAAPPAVSIPSDPAARAAACATSRAYLRAVAHSHDHEDEGYEKLRDYLDGEREGTR